MIQDDWNKINWEKVKYLIPGEFSENPIYAEPLLIYSLDEARLITNEKMFPSPVKGALARFTGNPETEHYAIGRLSKAGDVFCEGYPLFNFLSILSSTLFNGVGIYLDTTGPDGYPWIMFHLDIREKGFNEDQPLIWIADKVHGKNRYFYPQYEPQYWRLLRDERLYASKKHGIRISPKTNSVNNF